jgi:hypothetical protein
LEYDKFWGGKKVKEDRFKIVDERRLKKKSKAKMVIQQKASI